MGCRHWGTSLLHLHSMHKGRLARRCPALYGAGHGCWARHLWNVVLHPLRGLVVGLYRARHRCARPGWTVRRLPRAHLTPPLAIVIHALFCRHHLLCPVHAGVTGSLWRTPRATLSAGVVLIVHISRSLPHASLRTLRRA